MDLKSAVLTNIAWGTLIMVVYNYFVGKKQEQNTWGVIFEHLFIAFIVVLLTYVIGVWVNEFVVENVVL
jgi:predicted Na+-dependent transporter